MRFHLPAILSSLLAGSLLHQGLSIPLTTSDQLLRLDYSEYLCLYHSLPKTLGIGPRLLDLPNYVAPKHIKRDRLSWDEAVTTGKRNIAKLETESEEDYCADQFPSYTENYERGEQNSERGYTKFHTRDVPVTQLKKEAYWPNPFLQGIGIADEDQAIMAWVFAKNYPNKKRPKAVSQNAYMPQKGIILAMSNWKMEDTNAEDDKIPSGEIMMQVWDEFAGLDKRDGLRWIIRSHLHNADTRAIIEKAREKYGWGKRTVISVRRSSDPEAFEALSGTPNCRGVYATLASHDAGRTASWRISELLVWEEGPNSFIAMKVET
ncbi:hypothetical protein BDV18DRAFT_162297 [Aspergillus unguis]